MRVIAVTAYRQFQPFAAGTYGTSGGEATGFDSLIVSLETDEGLIGWGEMAPLGSFYSPAFAAGARAGASEIATHLIGLDPTAPQAVKRRLDSLLSGHPYVKSAFDIACWDLTAKAAGRSLFEMVGGKHGESVPLYRAIPSGSPMRVAQQAREYLAMGYRRLQVKVGSDPDRDVAVLTAVREAVDPDVVVFTDANGAWTTLEALRFVRLTRDIDLILEQPCSTESECATVRRACAHPMILDESIDSLSALLRVQRAGIADGVTIKLSRVGGITPALLLRDAAVELKLPVTIEDTGGASINTAALLHLSISTPESLRLHTCDFNRWVTADNATGLPTPESGKMRPPSGPGLGVEVDVSGLGSPFVQVAADASSIGVPAAVS